MKTLKKLPIVAVFMACSAQAALPPQYQNDKDLNIMLKFVKSHEEVISNLESVNMNNLTVIYRGYQNDICIASFTRKARTFDGSGPAGDLVFESSTCALKSK